MSMDFKEFNPIMYKIHLHAKHVHNRSHQVQCTGRISLWIIATVAGITVISLIGIFFYASYSGLGLSL
ncbi:hypothetical protein PHAVU_002G236100 [Phaseolus vulgaris]|uniref:Photosystem II reaction center protein J n=1 Tax=Phaseolus vulgaris TaxID=3885 RepID=V7CMN4_PHAVU|nr:hypothetical protein PHAVU_002G236100g [Phaseolus vulgaris]ESW31404.1 hypothetical protein PHAVU_002G236100g [Phaseolus vulgaris]